MLGSYALSLLGGAIIGLAASLLLYTHGRVAGISGILSGVFLPDSDGTKGVRGMRACFVVGLLAAGLIVARLHPEAFSMRAAPSLGVLATAGVIVGFGTRLGGGCTSGHGVCGLSRLSRRSLVATVTFMAVGMITVFVTRHLLGIEGAS